MDSIVILFISGLLGLFVGMQKKPLFSIIIASLGLIGAGVAANGGFIGNITHTIIEKNEEYKSEHGGKDMPFVANIKKIFKR